MFDIHKHIKLHFSSCCCFMLSYRNLSFWFFLQFSLLLLFLSIVFGITPIAIHFELVFFFALLCCDLWMLGLFAAKKEVFLIENIKIRSIAMCQPAWHSILIFLWKIFHFFHSINRRRRIRRSKRKYNSNLVVVVFILCQFLLCRLNIPFK